MNKKQLARLEKARLELERAWQTVRDLIDEESPKSENDEPNAWMPLSEADSDMAGAWAALNRARKVE